MPVPSKMARLPEDLREEMDQWIVEHGFGGYEAAAAWLAERARSMGLNEALLPKRSALQDYGSNLKRKLDAIRASTEASRVIADLFPDDEDARSAATITIAQSEIFNVLVALQDFGAAEPAERLKLLSLAGRVAADLARASITQKKWRQGVREKAGAAAEQVKLIERKRGISAETADTIRRLILGIAA
jgi:hypothetical protein